FWQNDEEFYRCAAKAPRPGCLLSTSKLAATGLRMRPVESALENALDRWQPDSQPVGELAMAHW
ncbi:MAG: hypothetical protein ABIV39_07910, partial [Verrucomicrobiota bacterium]